MSYGASFRASSNATTAFFTSFAETYARPSVCQYSARNESACVARIARETAWDARFVPRARSEACVNREASAAAVTVRAAATPSATQTSAGIRKLWRSLDAVRVRTFAGGAGRTAAGTTVANVATATA